MKPLSINIVGLSDKLHKFEYELEDDFFARYQQPPAEGLPFADDFIQGSKFAVTILLDKHETFLEADFKIKGHVTLVCDRSLETFEQPIRIDKRLVFKYGEEAGELSDEIVVVPRDIATLDFGQYVYEFVVLSLPMKRLHPKFGAEDDDESEGKMIYTSSTDNNPDNDVIDPRWEKLKKLK